MSSSLNIYADSLGEKLISFLKTIIGKEDDFNVDHRLFNSVCLIVAISFIIRIFINLLLGVKLVEIEISHILTFLGILSIFFISRFLRRLVLSRFLLVLIIIISFSFNWFYSGGTEGAMPFYYLSLLTVFAFVSIKRYKLLVVTIILINAALLIISEYKHPHLIIHKVAGQKLYIYKYIHLLFVAVVTMLIIYVGKRFYRTDEFAITELHQKIQNQLENDNNKLSEVFLNLTSQERKVLEQIHKGKRNKEIAAFLNIDISTVKTHINNIYKKKGVHSRTTLLNSMN